MPVTGEGADRDQVAKRAPRPRLAAGPGQRVWRPARDHGARGAAEKTRRCWPSASSWSRSPIRPTSHEPGVLSEQMRVQQGSTVRRSKLLTPTSAASLRRCTRGCCRRSATSLRLCGESRSQSRTGACVRSASRVWPTGSCNRRPARSSSPPSRRSSSRAVSATGGEGEQQRRSTGCGRRSGEATVSWPSSTSPVSSTIFATLGCFGRLQRSSMTRR